MMPDVSDAFWDFTTPVQFILLGKTIVDYEVTEVPESVATFDGVLEPIQPQRLMVKPENQRSWKWWTIWARYCLQTGNVIQDPSGTQYRIMSVQNWSASGHYQYEAVQDPQVLTPAPTTGS